MDTEIRKELEGRYISAFSNLFDVGETKVRKAVENHGLQVLYRVPDTLLVTEKQRRKYQSFHGFVNIEPRIRKEILIIRDSADAARFFLSVMSQHNILQESFFLLCLDDNMMPISHANVSDGLDSVAAILPQKVIREAILKNAKLVILGHNHPSGDVRPSHSDFVSTEKLKDIFHKLDIEVIDHIIISSANKKYYSLTENKEGVIRNSPIQIELDI